MLAAVTGASPGALGARRGVPDSESCLEGGTGSGCHRGCARVNSRCTRSAARHDRLGGFPLRASPSWGATAFAELGPHPGSPAARRGVPDSESCQGDHAGLERHRVCGCACAASGASTTRRGATDPESLCEGPLPLGRHRARRRPAASGCAGGAARRARLGALPGGPRRLGASPCSWVCPDLITGAPATRRGVTDSESPREGPRRLGSPPLAGVPGPRPVHLQRGAARPTRRAAWGTAPIRAPPRAWVCPGLVPDHPPRGAARLTRRAAAGDRAGVRGHWARGTRRSDQRRPRHDAEDPTRRTAGGPHRLGSSLHARASPWTRQRIRHAARQGRLGGPQRGLHRREALPEARACPGRQPGAPAARRGAAGPGGGRRIALPMIHETGGGGGHAARAGAGGAGEAACLFASVTPLHSHERGVKVLYGSAFHRWDTHRVIASKVGCDSTLACPLLAPSVSAPCSHTSTLHPPFIVSRHRLRRATWAFIPARARRASLAPRPRGGPACAGPAGILSSLRPPIRGPRRPYHLSKPHRGKGVAWTSAPPRGGLPNRPARLWRPRPEEPAYPTRLVSCGCPAWLGPGPARFGDALNICAQGVSFPSLPFRPRACPGGESRRVCVRVGRSSMKGRAALELRLGGRSREARRAAGDNAPTGAGLRPPRGPPAGPATLRRGAQLGELPEAPR